MPSKPRRYAIVVDVLGADAPQECDRRLRAALRALRREHGMRYLVCKEIATTEPTPPPPTRKPTP